MSRASALREDLRFPPDARPLPRQVATLPFPTLCSAASGGGDVAEPTANGGEIGELAMEAILERLTRVVERLEKGDLPLEESLKIFEEGVGLTRAGQQRLDAAEKRVEQLVQGGDGSLSVQPLTRA